MRSRFLPFLVVVVALAGSALSEADLAGLAQLEKIERLAGVYGDPGVLPLERAKALEEIIAGYQELLAQEAHKPATVEHILAGEIQWRLALARALVEERSRQARFGVEELGLGGVWSKDLEETLDRADTVLEHTQQRLEQLAQHMRVDEQFERNYVVTGLYLRVERAVSRTNYYQGYSRYCRALISTQVDQGKRLLEEAIEKLRDCWAYEAGKALGADQEDQQRLMLRNKGVLLISKSLRRINRLGEVARLLDWLENRSLDEQLAYQVGLERCRALADGGHYDTALAGLGQIRKWCRGKKAFDNQLPTRLTLGYLHCSILAAQAKELADEGQLQSAKRVSNERLEPLWEIFQAQKQGHIRQIIYEQINNTGLAKQYGSEVAGNNALEMLAGGVGLGKEGKTEAALGVFDQLLEANDSMARNLRAEILWQAGCAAREGAPMRACDYLGSLADEFQNSQRARQAAVLTVQIATELYQDQPENPLAQQVCLAGLERLMNRFPRTKDAQQWRLYWADILRRQGQLAQAAEQFGQIAQDDLQYAQARYFQLDCKRRLLDGSAHETNEDVRVKYAHLGSDFLELDRYVRNLKNPGEDVEKSNRGFAGRARLEAIRIFCTELNEPQMALLELTTFADDYEDQTELRATARRYRLVALGKLGRLDQAGRLSLELLRDDCEGAVEIVDAILRQLQAEFSNRQTGELTTEDQELARIWVELAKRRLSVAQEEQLPEEQKAQALIDGQEMLGQALFAAGELDEALGVFEELERKFPGSAEYVRAKGKIFLAQKKFEAAAAQWDRLIRGLKTSSEAWFEAWYWTLRTNLEAGGEPGQIARRIKQLQSLDAQMGSEENLVRFEELLKELDVPAASTN